MAEGSDETDDALQKIASGAGVVFFGTMLQLGLAFFAKALMARFLEVPQYGVISLGILVLNVGATVALAGLDTGVPRFMPRYDEASRRRGVVRAAYQLAVPLGVIIGVVIYAFAFPISTLIFNDSSLVPVLRVMAIGVPFWVLVDLGVGITRGIEDARPRVYAKNITLPGTRFLLVSVVALFGLGLAGMVWAYVASYAVAACVITYLVVRRTDVFMPAETTGFRRQLATFSLPLMFGGMSSFLIRNVDLVLLGVLRDPSQVAVYNVAYPLARLLTTAPGAFGFLFMPVVSNLHAQDQLDEAARVFQLTAKWLFLITVPVFLVMLLVPELLISVLFSAKYAGGALTLIVLATGFFTHSLLGLNANTLTSIGRPRAVMTIQGVSLIANVALNLLLIPLYGFLGAGIATTAAYLLQNALYSGMLYWTTGIHPFTWSMLRPAAVIGISTASTYLIVRATLGMTFPGIGIVFVVFGLAYVLGVVRFGGIDEEDVRLFNAVEEESGIDLTLIKRVIRWLIEA